MSIWRQRRVRIPVDGAVTSHMSSAAANATDDIGSEVSLFGAIVFAMSNTTTVLANLVLIVPKSTIQCSELSKLVTLMIILTFGGGSGRFNDLVNHSDTCSNFFLGFSENKAMKIFLCIVCILVGPGLAFLHAPLSTDADFSTAFTLHLFQTVATRTDE